MVNVQVSKGMYDKHYSDVELADGSKVDMVLKPVTGENLKKLLLISSRVDSLPKTTEKDEEGNFIIDNKEYIKLLSNGTFLEDCIDIVYDSVSRSYPEWDKDLTKEFVTINFMVLFPLVSQASVKHKK